MIAPVATPALTPQTTHPLLDIGTIYHEEAVPDYPRGREILDRFPDAERVVVPSHWQIPALHGNDALVQGWNTVKRTTLVLGAKKSLKLTPFERSADWVAPSTANGCAMACAYCYVARRKGAANPITAFVNIEETLRAITRHIEKQGWKFAPTQADDRQWVYELGTNSDASVDALVSDNLRDLVAHFRAFPTAKATFATKYVNRALLDYDPQGQTRLRFSLMPPNVARVVDVRTSPMAARIAAINDFVDAGYEVNVNFSARDRLRGLASGLCRLVHAPRRHAFPGGESATRGGGRLPHAQRRTARNQPPLAPEGRGVAVVSRHSGDENELHRRAEPPLPPRPQTRLGGGVSHPLGAAHAVLRRPLRLLEAWEESNRQDTEDTKTGHGEN